MNVLTLISMVATASMGTVTVFKALVDKSGSDGARSDNPSFVTRAVLATALTSAVLLFGVLVLSI